jgi:hypothetical protein
VLFFISYLIPPLFRRLIIVRLDLLTFQLDRLCGLVVRVLGYKMEMYCVSCEVRTEFIYVM